MRSRVLWLSIAVVAVAAIAQAQSKPASVCASQDAKIALLETSAAKYRAQIKQLQFDLQVARDAARYNERQALAACPIPPNATLPAAEPALWPDRLQESVRDYQDQLYKQQVLDEMRRANQINQSNSNWLRLRR